MEGDNDAISRWRRRSPEAEENQYGEELLIFVCVGAAGHKA